MLTTLGDFAAKPVRACPPQRKHVAVTYTGTSAGLLVLTEFIFLHVQAFLNQTPVGVHLLTGLVLL